MNTREETGDVFKFAPIIHYHYIGNRLASDHDLAAPVRGPLAGTLDHIHEVLRDNTLDLLTWVQLIVPGEAVWAGVGHAVAAGGVAVVDVTGNVEGRGAVQVGGRVVVDVGHLAYESVKRLDCENTVNEAHQSMNIVDGEARARVSLRKLNGKWRAVLVDGVHKRNVLHHLVADLGVVARFGVPVLVLKKRSACF